MTTHPSAAPIRCDCPRCAYDMSGPVARWSTSCELYATCPECGLEFAWGDVLNPTRVVPRWFYEAPTRPAFSTLPGTTRRMMLPCRFWSSINLATPLHMRRLVALLVGVLLATHLLLAVCVSLSLAAQVKRLGQWTTSVVSEDLPGIYYRIFAWPYATHGADVTLTYNTGVAGTPPMTTRTIITTDGLSGTQVLLPMLGLAMMPLSYLLLRQTLRRTQVRPAHLFRIFAYSSLLLLPMIALQILFARQWRDTILYTIRSSTPWFNSLAAFVDDVERIVPLPLVLVLIFLIFLGAWWSAATARYLRLPPPAGVVAAMVTITALVLAIIAAFTYRPW